MRIVILSSLAQDTGCHLRAQYLAEALSQAAEVRYLKPFPRTLPFRADMIISLPVNIIRVLFSKADVYIGMKPFPNVTLPLLIKKMLERKKIVVDIDDLDSGYRKGWAAAVSSLVQKPFPAYFDLVTYHNERLALYIEKFFSVNGDKLYRLEQGVDSRVFSPEKFDQALRRMFPEGRKIVLYTGHLNAACDLEEIMKAMKIVLDRVAATFIVAGGGPDEARFRRRAGEIGLPVYFTGRLSNSQAASYMSIADICLVYYRNIPVNYYRSSMKLRECLAMDKKVVTDDVGELKNFKEYTYQTIPDVKAYAEKIIEVLTAAADQREKSGGKHIRKAYDWNMLGGRFHERLNLI